VNAYFSILNQFTYVIYIQQTSHHSQRVFSTIGGSQIFSDAQNIMAFLTGLHRSSIITSYCRRSFVVHFPVDGVDHFRFHFVFYEDVCVCLGRNY
jgi:hypothetical protein